MQASHEVNDLGIKKLLFLKSVSTAMFVKSMIHTPFLSDQEKLKMLDSWCDEMKAYYEKRFNNPIGLN